MRYILLQFILVFLGLYSVTGLASPLIGSWQLDHDRTVSELNKINNLPQGLRSFLESYQDDSVYKFTKDKKYSIKNGNSVEQAYEIISSSGNSVTIKLVGGQMKNYQITYYFEKNAMYVLTSKYKVKRYYKRIAEK